MNLSPGTVRGPDASVELEVARDGTLTMACNTATASIEAVHIVFREQWTKNGMQCQDLSGDQSKFVYSKVLDGTITWSIAHQQLTITKGGAGLLKFTNATAGQ